MTIRFATGDETNSWNEKILKNPDGGDVLQSLQFAHMRELGGWKPRFVMGDKLALTVLEKAVPGLGNFWYLPKV